MPDIYRYGGFHVATDLALDVLARVDAPVDVELRVARSPGAVIADPDGVDVRRIGDAVVARSEGEVAFELRGAGPARLDVAFEEHVLPHRVEQLILDWVLPYVAAARGFLVMHATAVVLAGKVFAFCGASGRGKSTLAAALGLLGNELAADDTLVIDDGRTPPMVSPSHASSRLRSDSLHALMGRLATDPSRKTMLSSADLTFRSEEAPLGGIFLLRDGEKVEVAPLGAAGLSGLIEQTYIIDDVRSSVDRLIAVGDAVPLQSLRFPHDFDALPDLLECVTAHARDA